MYNSMAMYVAKALNIRPSEILDKWNVPELIVAYGDYANDEARRNFAEWDALDTKQKIKIERPPEYAVRFLGVI